MHHLLALVHLRGTLKTALFTRLLRVMILIQRTSVLIQRKILISLNALIYSATHTLKSLVMRQTVKIMYLYQDILQSVPSSKVHPKLPLLELRVLMQNRPLVVLVALMVLKVYPKLLLLETGVLMQNRLPVVLVALVHPPAHLRSRFLRKPLIRMNPQAVMLTLKHLLRHLVERGTTGRMATWKPMKEFALILIFLKVFKNLLTIFVSFGMMICFSF